MKIEITKTDYQTISKIANRMMSLPTSATFFRQKIDWEMDIEAAHQDVGLKLSELLKADDGNFAHDLTGIRDNLNRDTGKLENCFLPRYAVPE